MSTFPGLKFMAPDFDCLAYRLIGIFDIYIRPFLFVTIYIKYELFPPKMSIIHAKFRLLYMHLHVSE